MGEIGDPFDGGGAGAYHIHRSVREQNGGNLGKLPENAGGGDPADELFQLHVDPFAGNIGQQGGKGAGGTGGIRLHGEIEDGGKPHGAQDPQSVLLEPLLRLAHAADDPVAQVLLSPEPVHDPVAVAVRHRVDGEIAAGEVLLEGIREGHAGRVPVIRVHPVDSVRRGLDLHSAAHHGDGPMAQTRLHDAPIGKAAAHIVRARAGRHVVIAGGAAHEGIADTAADGIRGKTGILQAGNDVANRLRQKHSGILLWRKMEMDMGKNGKRAVEDAAITDPGFRLRLRP